MAFDWSKEQESVLSGRGNMLVSASAGSGKTAVMVEKALRLIKDGVDLRRILLMTFTKAAAAEMREKLVVKMYDSLSGENGNVVRKQLSYLPFAHIETIDGFCFSLMRKYFNIAGCDPSVVPGEPDAMAVVESECLDKVMERYFESKDVEFIKTADFFRQRRSYDNFKNVVLKIKHFASTRPEKDKFYDLCVNTDRNAIEKYYVKHKKPILSYFSDNLRRLIVDCENIEKTQKHLAIYKESERLLRQALDAGTTKEFFECVLRVEMPSKLNKQLVEKGIISYETEELSKVTSKDIKDYVKKCQEEYDVFKTGENAQQFMVRKKLVEVCKALEAEYDAYKKRRNLVDIADATYYTLKILGDDKAREEVKKSFDYIFIDEYQDTNYLQESLIGAISDGNVFSVGDVKQAIYHFRSAEPKIFIEKSASYESGKEGKNYYLNTNYRSCKSILDFTNRVCDKIMIKEFCDIDYKGTSRLNYGNTIKGDEDAVEVFVRKKEEEEKKDCVEGIYSVKNASVEEDTFESDFVATKILSLVGKEFYDDNKIKKAGFGNMAILMKNGAHFREMMKSLKKYGIPYYSARDTGNKFPERETLVNCLRCVLNADDDIALYSVCSSAIGGFTVSDMVTLRGQNSSENKKMSLWETLNSYKGEPNIERKANELIEFLEKMRTYSAFMTASETMEEILGHNFDVYLLANNADALAELNAFISYVSSLGANSSAADFIEYYDTSYKGNASPAKENAVTLMTMHGSKGLEYPFVFLPFQDRKGGNGIKSGVELDGELGMAVKFFSEENKVSSDTFDGLVLKMKNRDEERQELARLMYVAFTRAKNYLCISGCDVGIPSNVFDGASVLQWILYASQGDGVLRNTIKEMPKPTKTPDKKSSDYEDKNFDPSQLERKYEFEKETKSPSKYSVSEILKKQDAYGVNPFEYEKNTTAINLGVAVHTVLQKIDYFLDSAEKVENAVEEMRKSGFLTDEEAAIVPCDKIFATLTSDLIRTARELPCRREQPFVMYVKPDDGEEKVLVQGVIDLLIDKGDSFVVVDFKTGNSNEKKMAERYAKQLELYAEGVEKILKKPVEKKILFNVINGKTVVLP